MAVARRDRDRVGQAAHHDRRRRRGQGAVPQLPVAVQAPAFRGPVRQHRTRMPETRRDRDRGGEAAHHDRRRRVDQGAVPQLTEGVVAPAFGGPVRQQRTRMAAAGRDRDRVGEAAHRDRRRRVGRVPFPNSPTALKPQHLAVPFANTAHEWRYPPRSRPRS